MESKRQTMNADDVFKVSFDGDGGDEVENDNGDADVNLKKESGNSEEDAIPGFVDDVSNMVDGVNVANSSTHGSGKRKHRSCSMKKGERRSKRGSEVGAKLVNHFDRQLYSDTTSSESICNRRDTKGCSIAEVMAELNSIDGIVKGDNLYFYASELFCSRKKRDKWAAMGDIDTKLAWLNYMYLRR